MDVHSLADFALGLVKAIAVKRFEMNVGIYSRKKRTKRVAIWGNQPGPSLNVSCEKIGLGMNSEQGTRIPKRKV